MDEALEKFKTPIEVLPVLLFNESSHTEDNENSTIDCLKCDNSYTFPRDKDEYLAHLFLIHRLVIADVEDIACLTDYLLYWQTEFKNHELEEYCTTMLLDQLPDGRPAKNERYYLLCDILPKDFELRKRLQHQSLERALAKHQFELTDRNFSKECLYCRDVISGLRSDYLLHLFNKHFLQLGKPENLVYVDELISKVQYNLEHLICLYCEKIFKDRIALKEHMRKKGHKRINESNRTYDKYYLENYRIDKQNKTSKHFNQNKKSRKENPQTSKNITRGEPKTSINEGSVDFDQRIKNSSDDNDSDWSDWNDDKLPPLNCLFCNQKENDYKSFKEHVLNKHQVDFDESIRSLNFYQKIKVVNYVRRQICLFRCVTCNLRCENSELLFEHMITQQHLGIGTKKQWDKPEYFFPTYEDDGLLYILDDNPNDDTDETVVRIISEDTMAQINKDAERLSLEGFQYL
ncbi:zinc finger protein 277-like [Teleopsis dalmanni]|uniref:zinc finger protein 277-like n=1 Tax=Teleopsis dalmanni TaxID=139649 RepID=UPI0018CF97E3|nr:zinc finger protein 277-like [Teleopsis dalmanni]XP_037955044.1 zinc finger protein 277-like [Teleopsis dalmanni]